MEHKLTRDQIRWAAAHDWFGADNGDGTITVVERWSDLAGEQQFRWAGTFQELRAWAGY